MKINKLEYYTDFIKKYIKQEQNTIISSNKIYTLFCSIYDVNPKHFEIKSFTPNFIKAYNLLFKENLKKTSRRLTIGERPTTCFMNIDLKTIFTVSKQVTASTRPISEQDANANFKKTSLKTNKVRTEQTVSVHSTNIVPTGNTVNMDMFLDYFVPGEESDPIILTKDFYELYNTLYEESPEHKKLIPNITDFKKVFKKYWAIRYPNNELKDARKSNERGFKFIKRIK